MYRSQDLVSGLGAGGVSILLSLQGQASDPRQELSSPLYESMLNPPTNPPHLQVNPFRGILASGFSTLVLGLLTRPHLCSFLSVVGTQTVMWAQAGSEGLLLHSPPLGLVCNVVCVWVSSYSLVHCSQVEVYFALQARTSSSTPKVWIYSSNRKSVLTVGPARLGSSCHNNSCDLHSNPTLWGMLLSVICR